MKFVHLGDSCRYQHPWFNVILSRVLVWLSGFWALSHANKWKSCSKRIISISRRFARRISTTKLARPWPSYFLWRLLAWWVTSAHTNRFGGQCSLLFAVSTYFTGNCSESSDVGRLHDCRLVGFILLLILFNTNLISQVCIPSRDFASDIVPHHKRSEWDQSCHLWYIFQASCCKSRRFVSPESRFISFLDCGVAMIAVSTHKTIHMLEFIQEYRRYILKS